MSLSAGSDIGPLTATVEVIRFSGLFNPNAIYPCPYHSAGWVTPVNQNEYSDHVAIGRQVVGAQQKGQ